MTTYFDFSEDSDIDKHTRARASGINAVFKAIEVAFGKIPTEEELKQSLVSVGIDNGTANSYDVSSPYPPSGYTAGMQVVFKVANANTGAATLTLRNQNDTQIGAKAIKRIDGADLIEGDMPANSLVTMRYNDTGAGYFELSSVYGDVILAGQHKDAAASSASAAGVSETNAKTSETNAANSASAAGTSANAADTSATEAASSASAAGASADAAASSASAADTSATEAASSASAAGASENAADTSAISANASASTASSSASSALNSASAASNSASAASASANAAGTSETNAASSASAASTSATNASDKAAEVTGAVETIEGLIESGGGVTDHDQLNGRDATDAHTQYLLKAGGAMTGALKLYSDNALTTAIDFDTANAGTLTATADTVITFNTTAAAGAYAQYMLTTVNGGAYTLTWPLGISWAGGAAPTLQASGIDKILITTADGGVSFQASHTWSPSVNTAYAASDHVHAAPTVAGVVGLSEVLDAKANSDHTHASEIAYIHTSSNHSAAHMENITVDASAGPVTITFPAAADGARVWVTDLMGAADSNMITLDLGSAGFEGAGGEDMIIDIANIAVGLEAQGGTWWRR